MNTDNLLYFIEVASGKTYLTVSEECNTSLSSVSKGITHLEDELGVKLFDRSSRSVRLTDSGHALADGLQVLRPQYEKLLQAVRQAKDTVNFICEIDPSLSNFDCEVAANRVKRAVPDKHVHVDILIQENLHDGRNHLRFGNTTALVCHRNIISDQLFISKLISKDPLYVLLPSSHPCSSKSSLSFQDIYNETIIISASFLFDAMDEICTSLNVVSPPNLIRMSRSEIKYHQIIRRVARGMGISVFFGSQLGMYNLSNVSCIPLIHIPDFPFVMYLNRNRLVSNEEEQLHEIIKELVLAELSLQKLKIQ